MIEIIELTIMLAIPTAFLIIGYFIGKSSKKSLDEKLNENFTKDRDKKILFCKIEHLNRMATLFPENKGISKKLDDAISEYEK